VDLLGRVERLRSELSARLEVDVPGLVAGVRARLEGSLQLAPLPIDADLIERRGPLGVGRVRSSAFESPELRKCVLTHLAVRPLIEGLQLVAHPRREVAAPTFAAELTVLPTRITASADVYGPPARTAGVLEPLQAAFARLQSAPAPEWAAAIASGEGLNAAASPRQVDELFAALTGALGRWLEVVAAAPRLVDEAGTAAAQRDQEAFFAAFHAHGPRAGVLGRLFGSAWAERYSRLAFE
jgi:hypothetical protein